MNNLPFLLINSFFEEIKHFSKIVLSFPTFTIRNVYLHLTESRFLWNEIKITGIFFYEVKRPSLPRYHRYLNFCALY